MKQKYINYTLFILVAISILATFIKVIPSCVITNDTYIGIMVSLLGIVVALLIGYQIFNVIQFRTELGETKKKNDEMFDTNNKIILQLESDRTEMREKYKMQNSRMDGKFNIISSIVTYNSGQYFLTCYDAFVQMYRALLCAIDSNDDDLDFIYFYLKKFISEMNRQSFSQGFLQQINGQWQITNDRKELEGYSELIDKKTKTIKDWDNSFRKHRRFKFIKFEYEKIMTMFWDQIDKIKKDPNYQIKEEEIDYILHH